MSNDIIFKTFRTYRHPYVYDRHTNALVRLTDVEYEELFKIENMELLPEKSEVIKKYQEFGLFHPNAIEKIENNQVLLVEQYLKSRLTQLTLQVTQQCNLRCKYCAFSGIYEHNRIHSSSRMELDVAKKAIDFFLKRVRERSDITIGFYGGEPLLEFDLIKQCVEYTKAQVEGKRINFTLTTNGTLMPDYVIDYLVDNDFLLNISLDGSKTEHDASRQFADGEGTFDVIIENIKKIGEKYPKYKRKIQIMTTINPHMDLGCVLEYFQADEVLASNSVLFNPMSETNLKQQPDYDANYYRVRNYEYIKALFYMIGKIDGKYLSPLSRSVIGLTERNSKQLSEHFTLPSTTSHGGACKIGVRRLFVRVDGSLFPCERVNEMLDYFMIGTLETGFDIDKIDKILNIGKLTANECKKCWALRFCVICAGQIECENEPCRVSKLVECTKSVNQSLFGLYELCVLMEYGYDAGR
jgi:uncharacterized protein